MKHVYIIGAGASGLMAACRAAELGARVTVYEALSTAGKKLSATGNGRCNFTNADLTPEAYHIKTGKVGGTSSDAAASDKMFFYDCFKKFDNNDAIRFFRSIGIPAIYKSGNVYPESEEASSVVRALVRRCERLGVNIVKNHRIESIKELKHIDTQRGEALILACGSKAMNKSCNSYRLLEELGVRYSWIAPALCALYCKGDDKFFKAAQGVRCHAILDGVEGELQFTDYGISGIPAFNVSRDVSEAIRADGSAVLSVNFMPGCRSESGALSFFRQRLFDLGLDTECPDIGQLKIVGDGYMNLKLWTALIDRMQENAEKSKEKLILEMVVHELMHCEFTAYKTAGFDRCQVCSGGIGPDEINPEDMQLKKHSGIYACGEILDMDSICGGYNLQWAWTSGYIAGTYAAGGKL